VNRLAYDFIVRYSTLFLILFPLLSTGHAQVVPGIVPTGAVHPVTGAVRPFTGPVQPPTATPVLAAPHGSGAHGFAPNSPHAFAQHDGRAHHRDPYPYLGYGEVYGYGVPYADDPNAGDQGYDATDDSNYQGGPTVFDRRGSGADSYVPPVQDVPTPHSAQADNSAPEPQQPQPAQASTVLVFKDGHKLEVGNYAIVGTTLFDLTSGHPRKIALADLDLEATQKQNDDRGVVFQLPPSLQAT
jgi:hypothetical protein